MPESFRCLNKIEIDLISIKTKSWIEIAEKFANLLAGGLLKC
jgi:hypothetical protein